MSHRREQSDVLRSKHGSLEIPEIGAPLMVFQRLDSNALAQLNAKRFEYAAFRLGSARGMKGEISRLSLSSTDCGTASVSSELSEPGQDLSHIALFDSDEDGSNEEHATSMPNGMNVSDVPSPPSNYFPRPRRRSIRRGKTSWAPHVLDCQCFEANDDYHTLPPASFVDRVVKARYESVRLVSEGGNSELLNTVLARTPKPKGFDMFSSIHVVAPAENFSPAIAEPLVDTLKTCASDEGIALHVHRLPVRGCLKSATAMDEYEAIFETASSVILAKADRTSLLLYVGWEDHSKDAYAALIGMLPFRGISTALLTQRAEHGDLLLHSTPSGVFQVDGRDAGRMGMFPVHAVFGPLSPLSVSAPVEPWDPVDLFQAGLVDDVLAQQLPFKIGGLALPMINHNAEYSEALRALASTIKSHFTGTCFFPIVSCGESCDALGYGQDVLDAIGLPGLLFTHRSGETYKRYDNYCSKELFEGIAVARSTGGIPVIIAVGGGVNGNSMGLIAAVTGSAFIEVPTTPMHFNDATTSAKKAFSLVVDDKILSKNILGAFYLPKLVFCVNEMLLTSSPANIHATIGESTKTMNMLGMANSATGARDYHNILGASEFASNTISIVRTAGGFDRLVKFVSSPGFLALKSDVMNIGRAIVESRKTAENDEVAQIKLTDLLRTRFTKMRDLRAHFHSLPEEEKASIKEFLTVVNREIVAAKAMFLAYSDPFEKYRALLFEYAHTLGHGVEAFANGLYAKCHAKGIPVPDESVRLHGQCVGMAVLWAGRMSQDLGLLDGAGLHLHQALGYLFNRHNGFSFKPLRVLCDTVGISQEVFCEEVLSVVRRDNKRGYVAANDASRSVDQLVSGRPGKMVRSDDVNAELRYLVEVDEDWQRKVLCEAFASQFDKVADLQNGKLVFVDACSRCHSHVEDVAEFVYTQLADMYAGC